MAPVGESSAEESAGTATVEEPEAALDDGDSTLPSSRLFDAALDDGDSTLPSSRLPGAAEDCWEPLDDEPTPMPRRKRWELPDGKQRKTAKRLRGIRRLEQALEEGARAAVLEAAIIAAKEAGCEEPPHSQLVECGEARLELVARLEEAYQSGDLVTVRAAVAAADAGGAGAHAETIRTELCAWEARALAEEALTAAKSAEELEGALTSAREAGVASDRLAFAETSLAEMRIAEVRVAAMGALEAADSVDALKAAIDAARVQCVDSTSLLPWYLEKLRTMISTSVSSAAMRALAAAADPTSLETAISAAREAGIEAQVLRSYERSLAEMRALERKAKILLALERAADSEELAIAVMQARQEGVCARTLGTFESLLRLAVNAAGCLAEAVESRNCEKLRVAIAGARFAKLTVKQIQCAEEVLAIEEPREKLQEQIELAMAELFSCGDAGSQSGSAAAKEGSAFAFTRAAFAVRELINVAREIGIPEANLLEKEELIAREERRRRALADLDVVVAETCQIDLHMASIGDLALAKARLTSSISEALLCGIPEQELLIAERHRRKVHNAVEDRKGAVRVFCRVRPILPFEVADGRREVVFQKDFYSVEVPAPWDTSDAPAERQRPQTARSSDASQVKRRNAAEGLRSLGDRDSSVTYSFDGCWYSGSQEEVFEDTKDLVQSAIDGYNVTIFAYGQTGAGKTFTMYGGGAPEQSGICPRSVAEVFAIVERDKARFDFKISLSIVELYCQRWIDLMDSTSRKVLKIRTVPSGEVYMENVCEEYVTCEEEVLRFVDRGLRDRHSRDTLLNTGSSRSHLLFTLKIDSVNRETGARQLGKLLLVDLAGSERIKKSEVTGDGLKEAIEINKSLTALGDVISSLTRGGPHVPYRNHELTQVMQDSLGGTAKTLMFVNLAPTDCNREETLMSLKYAQRAKGVLNNQQRPAVSSARGSISSVSSARVST